MATATLIPTSNYHPAFSSPGQSNNADRFFSGLDDETVSALAKVSSPSDYDAEEIVFSEGDPAHGMYLLVSGKVKLTVSSSDGKSLILRILNPGDVFSLSSVMLARPQETSAEALERSTVSFVKRADLFRLMNQHGDLAMKLAHELSLEYAGLCEEMSTLGLQRSAMSRLAKLIVGWTEGMSIERGPVQLDCPHTHEVVAQMIGTSRETVTRLLHQLRHQRIAAIKNEVLIINNFPALQALAV